MLWYLLYLYFLRLAFCDLKFFLHFYFSRQCLVIFYAVFNFSWIFFLLLLNVFLGFLCAFSSAGPHFDFFHCFCSVMPRLFLSEHLSWFDFFSCIFIYIYSLSPFPCRCFSAHTLVSLSARSCVPGRLFSYLSCAVLNTRCSFLEFYLLLQASSSFVNFVLSFQSWFHSVSQYVSQQIKYNKEEISRSLPASSNLQSENIPLI